MLDPSTDELLDLLQKYKITIKEIGADDTVKLERYGIIISYSQKELCTRLPKQVIRDIIMKTIQDPEYKAKTHKYVKGLIKKQIKMEVKYVAPTIDDKKKLIREKLIKDGII